MVHLTVASPLHLTTRAITRYACRLIIPPSTWFGPIAHIRLYLDIVVGSTKPNTDHDRSLVSVLASRLWDLNIKIEDIRREQQYQREREADIRNLSETTNSHAVWYSIAQIAVLLSTCPWQLRHLRVSIPWPYFI